MAVAQLFIWFSLFSITFAATTFSEKSSSTSCDSTSDVGCLDTPTDCELICGCDGTLIYDTNKEDCVLSVKFVRKEILYPVADDNNDDGMSLEDAISNLRHEKVDKVFRGIIISALFFIVCASICVVSVCVYCCHIRHSDRKLKQEVTTLAKKLKIDLNKKDSAPLVRKKQRDQKEESCNVVVTEANVLCV